MINLNFRSADVMDTEGNVVKDEKGAVVKTKRASFSLNLAYPTAAELIEILGGEDAKQIQLIMDSISETVNSSAKQIVSDDLTITDDATFPHDKVTWLAIANQPAAQRRGGGISKEQWADFLADYITAVQLPEVGKSLVQATNQAKVLGSKFSAYRSDKKVLAAFKELLAAYLQHSPNAAEYVDCVEALVNKADEFMNADAVDALGL